MKRLVWLMFSLLFVPPLMAADLLQVYRAALENDPIFAAASFGRAAGREKTPQARAGLLPSLMLSGNTTWNKTEFLSHDGPVLAKPQYNSNGYQLTLSQPLFRWQNWLALEQAKLATAQSEINFVQARQDLVLRVAQAYFDVNFASENLRAVLANKMAIAQQLASAKKNFEVGSATITDTHEAQARFDLATAQEIAAESDLEVRQRVLQSMTASEPQPLSVVRSDALLTPPQPQDMQQWVAAAEKDSLAVQAQEANVQIAAREVDKQRAGHYPTVDLVANHGYAKTFTSVFGLFDNKYDSLGIQVNIPLYQGGLLASRQSEAAANRGGAESNLEAARRSAALAARQYYLAVVSGLAQVQALKAALVSSLSALESNKLGYEVGVRINIDVLNAENQVYVTRRDLVKAVLDTLMAQLRLKGSVGALADDDLTQVNALLVPSSAQ